MDREQAARIGGMDRQTLRDWVHRFNKHGPAGRKDIPAKGGVPRLASDQLIALAEIVKTDPDRAKDGLVQWRRVELKQLTLSQAGITKATYFNWRKRLEGLTPPEIWRLKQLEGENAKLRNLVADLSLDRDMLQDVIRRKISSLVVNASLSTVFGASGT